MMKVATYNKVVKLNLESGRLSSACSASKDPGWSQGHEGTSWSPCGAALYGARGPRTHPHLGKEWSEVPCIA